MQLAAAGIAGRNTVDSATNSNANTPELHTAQYPVQYLQP